jgi:hypothetical protein
MAACITAVSCIAAAQDKREKEQTPSEAVLELQTLENNSQKPPQLVFEREDMRYKNTDKPEGVIAPEGELQWGNLTLGEHSYLTCIEKKGDKFTKLYLDKNNNKNLAEETPIENDGGRGISFVVDSIKGAFRFQGALLSFDMKVHFMPGYDQSLVVFTAYTGTIKTELGEFELTWLPGENPSIRRLTEKGPYQVLVVGRKKLSADVSLKNGKVVASYAVVEDGLVPVETSDSLQEIELYVEKPKFIVTRCLPGDGKIYIPKGKYDAVNCIIKKNKDDVEYGISLGFADNELEIKDSIKIKAEPLTLKPDLAQENGAVTAKPRMHNADGREARVFKFNGSLEAPKLVIKDAEGKEVASHVFVYG